ncbi:MAG TPA: SRPBCC family protein [Chthoniobacterales bacterium]|nr:SRPBCC family protein [Chthoniobacterales bacterium]
MLEKELLIGILQWCGICQTGLAVVLQNLNRWKSVPKIFYSVAIPSSIERVWSIIRDFNELPSWYPEVYGSSIEDNRLSDAVGCVRSLYLKGGGHFRERLLALSDHEHKFTYTILESPLPIRNYVSTVQLRAIIENDQTYAEWTSDFDCAPDVEAELTTIVLGVYRAGFDCLKAKFKQ